jgi:two-component sensor histidine kinase
MHLAEIIRLQRGQTAPAEGGLNTALGDLESRLRGMEVVHSMLSSAHWSALPLNDMVTEIVNAALSGSPIRQQIQVSVVAPVEPLRVVPEQATAVGLIINELATNSVKYAFRNRAQGRLDVRLRVEATGPGRPLVRLEYRDDGPGWPEGVLRGQSKAIGLRLIQASVRSPLRGELALRNENGAVAEVAFKLALPD